jgi:hypothetical protein
MKTNFRPLNCVTKLGLHSSFLYLRKLSICLTTDEILDGTIAAEDIADDAVTASKMGKKQEYAENESSYTLSNPLGVHVYAYFPAMEITITSTTHCDITVWFDHRVSSDTAGKTSSVEIEHNGSGVATSEVHAPTYPTNLKRYFQTQALHTTLTNVAPGTPTFKIYRETVTVTLESKCRHMTVLALPTG